MKTRYIFTIIAMLVLTQSGCRTSVKRVDADRQVDLSGYWNDTDVRLVCDTLIRDCVNSERVSNYLTLFTDRNDGRIPTVIVGSFRNNSSEHIDTELIARRMEIAILNSGKLGFVAGGDTRIDLRAEREDQQTNSSAQTVSALRNETGANFMLTGAVNLVEDRERNRSVRSYFVSAELTNIETNERLWMGENDEIKKVIRRPSAKL